LLEYPVRGVFKVEGRREKGEGRREEGEGRREKGEGRREFWVGGWGWALCGLCC
jgi:hypothetical protein